MPFQNPPDFVQIDALRNRRVAEDQSTVFEGNVVVRYGSTKVTADRLVAYEGQQRGVAEGHVVLVDPAGTANADRLEFSWDPKNNSGKGTNVSIRVGNAYLRARQVDFTPKEWTLLDVEGTTCLQPRPVYFVTSERVTVSTGKQAVIHQPRVSFLGKFIAELPTQRASLVAAVPGIGYPSPRYKLDRGFGLTWAGGLLVGRQETFNFNANAYAKKPLGAFAQYTHSFLPMEKATEVVAPRTDFSERAGFGFFNSIRTGSPEEESRYIRARRSSLSADVQLRGGVADRDRGQRYSKLEAVYEVGGAEGKVGYLASARLQGIQPLGEGMEPRLKLMGSAGLPTLDVAKDLQLLTRIDSEGFLGATGYAWIQATSGFSYLPTPGLRLSMGGFLSGDLGTPQFGMDPLFAEQGLVLRSDLKVGGLTFTYLIKREFGQGTYDHEFAFRQVIGCFEAFYSKREYPRSRNVGLTLRVQPVLDLLKRRIAEVTGKGATGAEKGSVRPPTVVQ